MRARRIDEAFAVFARDRSGFEARTPQRIMAAAVHRAFEDGGSLAVEAPTGVGKSLAYLIPAAIHARERGRVIVSTHTKHLQAQIVERDAPAVERAIAPGLRVSLLKGRMNYVCLRRWQKEGQRTFHEGARQAFFDRVATWMAHTETGDVDELGVNSSDEREWIRAITAPEDLETAAMCARTANCLLRESRRRAGKSDVVVVNHALLLTHLLTPAVVLPESTAVVVDEAHMLPDVAMRILEHRASPSRFRAAISRLSGGADPMRLRRLEALADRFDDNSASALREHVERLRSAIHRVRTMSDHFFAELATRSTGDAVRYDRRAAESEALPRSVDAVLLGIRDVLEPAQRITEIVVRRPPDDETEEELVLSFASAVGGLGAYLASLTFTVEVPDDDYVYWQEREPEPALVAVPLHPGRELSTKLLDAHETVVLTSATLAVGDDFSHFVERVGVTADTIETLSVDTPFPLSEQVLAVAPPMPAPTAATYDEAVSDAIAGIALAARRNMLVLVTSHRMLRAVHERLKKRLRNEVPLLGQGIDGDRAAVSAAFRELRGGVLLGTASFFEGVDFPGAELEILVLTRLPFPVPTDPIVSARCEQVEANGSSAFARHMIPEAVLRFRQGFGRLIRRGDDRGVFVILDSRIRTARYRGRFLSALPVPVDMPESRDAGVSRVREWFDVTAPLPGRTRP